jgi:hypothetical protein
MENINKLLSVLEQKKLHVHELTDQDRKAIGTLVAYDPRHSVYVMNSEGEIVHCGTPSSVEWFAHQYQPTESPKS